MRQRIKELGSQFDIEPEYRSQSHYQTPAAARACIKNANSVFGVDSR